MIVVPVNSKTHGEHFIFIDGEDFDKVKDYKWHIVTNRQNGVFYARARIKDKCKLMHCLLLDFPKNNTDHKNGNGLDNRRENIRVCTASENMRNRRKQKAKVTSVYKGVHFFKPHNKYSASISVNKKRIFLGYFENEHAAAEAYNKKAIELHGEFALLNIIQGETSW